MTSGTNKKSAARTRAKPTAARKPKPAAAASPPATPASGVGKADTGKTDTGKTDTGTTDTGKTDTGTTGTGQAASGMTASPIPTAPAAIPDPAAPVVVKQSPVSVAGPDLKKQELLSMVVTRSGVAKRDAKPVVDAMLDLLGEALEDGRSVNLNPMGKIIVKKTKPVAGGTVLTARIRLKQKN